MYSDRLIIGYDNNKLLDEPALVVLKEEIVVVAGLQFPVTTVVNTLYGKEAESLYNLLTKNERYSTDPELEERT